MPNRIFDLVRVGRGSLSEPKMDLFISCAQPAAVFGNVSFRSWPMSLSYREAQKVIPVWCTTTIMARGAIVPMTARLRLASKVRPPALRMTLASAAWSAQYASLDPVGRGPPTSELETAEVSRVDSHVGARYWARSASEVAQGGGRSGFGGFSLMQVDPCSPLTLMMSWRRGGH